MMLNATDIDIDIKDRDDALNDLSHVRAIEIKGGEVRQHPSGVYLQSIPRDPETDLCSLDYKQAEDIGYFKFDLLSSSIYDGVESSEHLDRLLARETDWELLEHREIVADLFHIANHFGVVQSIRPKSIEDLAVVLALIRSGKRHLIGQDRQHIDENVWTPSSDGYWFKRAHAIAYAHIIVVQLNLMCEQTEEAIEDKKLLEMFDAS